MARTGGFACALAPGPKGITRATGGVNYAVSRRTTQSCNLYQATLAGVVSRISLRKQDYASRRAVMWNPLMRDFPLLQDYWRTWCSSVNGVLGDVGGNGARLTGSGKRACDMHEMLLLLLLFSKYWDVWLWLQESQRCWGRQMLRDVGEKLTLMYVTAQTSHTPWYHI